MIYTEYEKILHEELERLMALRKNVDNELDQFNKKMDAVLGGDSRSMYRAPCQLVDDYIIDWIMRRLKESKEGAEWFLYEVSGSFSPDEEHAATVEVSGRKYLITSIKSYVRMCMEVNLNNEGPSGNSGRK